MLSKIRSLLQLSRSTTPVVESTEPARHATPTVASQPWIASRFDDSIRNDPDRPGTVWYTPERAAFESAETSRLNEAHWSVARDTPINDDLADRLPTMRTRANHEAWNNTSIEGLILQHSIAVAGDDGPLLDLQAVDEAGDAWCEQAERIWEEWCSYSDAADELTLGSRIKNHWNRSCWTNGEWFDQLYYDQEVDTPLQLRLHAIEPQRIYTPNGSIMDPSIVLGVKRNTRRKPLEYWVGDDWYGYGYNGSGTWIQSRNMLHGFDKMEVGQARGVPWAQSGLPTAADLRDYDDQVMDAARSAADMAIFAQAKHPDAEYVETNRAATFRRRRINHIAPGWELATLNPTQPQAQYKEHRHERMGDLGRGRGVPSMVLRLDARDHNYSSARFDRGLLHESACHVRSVLYNPRLRRLVRIVISEAILAGILPFPPVTYSISFVWPAMPQVDEDKAAKAENRYMGNGTLSYSEACISNHGRRVSDVIRRRQRDDALLAAAGLPSVIEMIASGNPRGGNASSSSAESTSNADNEPNADGDNDET